MSNIPGPPSSNPLIGNVRYIQASPETIFRRLREAKESFYPVYKFFALYQCAINLLSPEDCELVMSNPAHNTKGKIYDLLHRWLGDGLLTSTDTKWQTRRKILTPAFHFNVLQKFVQIFNEGAEELVEVLRRECIKSEVDIRPHITQFTLQAIAETAMGVKLQFKTKKEKDYKQALQHLVEILMYKLIHPWFILKTVNLFSPWYLEERRVTGVLHDYTKMVIKEREKGFNETELPKEEHDVYKGRKRMAMLDLLLLAKRKEGIIDDAGIQEEVDTFMFEGHDTTSAALSFALMNLACHKNCQDLILQEMKEVLGDIHKKPTFTDLQNMKYLERCIKESLRIYPSVFFIARTLGEDMRSHSGYFLPKGTTVVMHIYDIHHNADIYPDPEKFDPDRFLPENSQNRHPYAYLPFSAGPRNCIGQKFAILELKAAICAILAAFELEPVDTPETIELVVDLVLSTKEGIKIKLVPRVEKI